MNTHPMTLHERAAWAQQLPARAMAANTYLTATFSAESPESLLTVLAGYELPDPRMTTSRALTGGLMVWVYEQPETQYLCSSMGSIGREITSYGNLASSLATQAKEVGIYVHPTRPPLMVLKVLDGYLVMQAAKLPNATFR